MQLPRFVLLTLWIAMMLLGASKGSAQNFPTKPLRIVTSGAGGGNDFIARQVAQGISGSLGQAVIVENRGGGGLLTGEIVANAVPDGHTLALASNSVWIGPLFGKMPYDMARDFAPISTTTFAPVVLVVHPSVPAASVKELIAYAKANPAKLNYGSGATGTSIHLAAELFKAMAGINMVRIPYPGGGGAVLNDVVAGQIQTTFLGARLIAPHIKAGRLKALAVTSAQPSPLAPGLPTMAAAGVPGYEMVALDGILAPAKTPTAVIKRLNQEIRRFLEMPETKERLFNTGVEAVGDTPDGFAAKIRADIATVSKLIKEAGVATN